MAQELNLIPRDANYFNPFSDEAKIKVKYNSKLKQQDLAGKVKENKNYTRENYKANLWINRIYYQEMY